MACASSTSAVSRGTAILASSSRRTPWSNAVSTVMGASDQRALIGVLLQFLGLVVGGEGVENGIHLALHHEIQLMQRQADAVIRHAVLREVVGADLFAAIAGAHHAAPLRAQRRLLFLELQLVKPRAQHTLGLGAVLDLRFFVLARDYQARRQMR